MATTVKIENRQGMFGKEFKLTQMKMHKPAGTVLNWTSGANIDAFLKEHGFKRLPNGTYETDKEYKKGAFAAVEATDGDIPIGTSKINTGQGINNYVPPALPVQGALQRLMETKE